MTKKEATDMLASKVAEVMGIDPSRIVTGERHKNNQDLAYLQYHCERSIMDPVLYIDEFSKELAEGKADIDSLRSRERIMEIASALSEAVDNTVFSEDYAQYIRSNMLDKGYVLEHCYIEAMGKDANLCLMEDHVSFSLHDLIGVVAVDCSDGGNTGNTLPVVKITRRTLQAIGIEEEELIERAKLNTVNRSQTCTIGEMIASITGCDPGVFDSAAPFQLFVTTSSQKYDGAGIVLCNMDKVLDKLNTDQMIVFPSSVHEVITVVSDCGIELNGLKEQVVSINADVVSPQDKLTDNVYFYTRGKGLTVAEGCNH